MQSDDKTYYVGETPWIYIFELKAPSNKDIHILTAGGTSVKGRWVENMGYIAWAPLHKRSQAKEELQAKLQANIS
jgi:hypothetical protein